MNGNGGNGSNGGSLGSGGNGSTAGTGGDGAGGTAGGSVGGAAAEGAPLYTVKWPKAAAHATKSVSGVLVESNVRGQLALHFYNEVRELEPQVEYMEDGARAGRPRSVAYVREITDSILLSGATARQLRDVLGEFLSVSPRERPSDS